MWIARLSTPSIASFMTLRKRRMRVAGTRHVFGGRHELHRQHGLGDLLGGMRMDHVHAEDGSVAASARTLTKPARCALRQGPAVSGVRKALGDPLRLQLLFGLAHPRDLRRGVDHPGMVS